MSGKQVADFLLERLRGWGVTDVFGYPGDGINGLIAAFGRADDDPRFRQARHEEMAAFSAVGYAKFTDRVGVCMATSGPGAIHLLNGLYDAKLDHVPVVAIVGQTARTAMGGSYQQEVNLPSIFEDVAGFVETVTVPEQLPGVIDRAMRVAKGRRTPAVVIVHADVQELEYAAPTHAFKMVPSSEAPASSAGARPDSRSLDAAAEILNAGTKVAVLVGSGARNADVEVMQLADLLGAGVAKALLGKDVLSDELPYVTGSIGLLGTRPSYELMRDCDTLLVIGSSFPYSQFLPKFGQARGIQIDADPTMIGMRYPFELNLVGDARATLQALIPRLTRKTNRDWQEKVKANVADWWETMDSEAMAPAEPINPMRMFSELSTRLPDNAIIVADAGSAANWYARNLRFRGQMRGSLSGTLATMGCGVPYAFGAKTAHPDRPVVALVGDGAMQMNGLAELITIAKYWEEWDDPRLVVGVLHNDDLNQVTWELRAMGGSPTFPPSQSLPSVEYAGFAERLGLAGRVVDDPEELGHAWELALGADRPVVLDVHVDPNVPPIPPHATFEQMKDTAKALIHGDEQRWGVVREGIRTKAREVLHRTDR